MCNTTTIRSLDRIDIELGRIQRRWVAISYHRRPKQRWALQTRRVGVEIYSLRLHPSTVGLTPKRTVPTYE